MNIKEFETKVKQGILVELTKETSGYRWANVNTNNNGMHETFEVIFDEKNGDVLSVNYNNDITHLEFLKLK